MGARWGKGNAMATDYDAPRKNEDDVSEDSIEELKSRRNDAGSAEIEEDETEAAENFELPGADLSKEELTVHVVPRQDDEFTCSQCFLVHHSSQLAYTDAAGQPVSAQESASMSRVRRLQVDSTRTPRSAGTASRRSGPSPGATAPSRATTSRPGSRWSAERR